MRCITLTLFFLSSIAYPTIRVLAQCGGGAVTPVLSIVCAGGSKQLTGVGAMQLLDWQTSADSMNWTTVLAGTTDTTFTLTNILENTYVRFISASDTCDTVVSSVGLVQIAQTPELEITDITSNSVTVSWTPFAPSAYGLGWSGSTTGYQSNPVSPFIVAGLPADAEICVFVNLVQLPQCPGVQMTTICANTLPDCNFDFQFAVTNSVCNEPNAVIDADVSGGTPPYQITWSNGTTTEDLANIPAGIYYITVTDANGCTAWTGTEVFTTPPVELTLTSTPVCLSSGVLDGEIEASLSGGSQPFQLFSDTGAFVSTGLDSGWYEVTVVDGVGCTDTDSVFVNYHVGPHACITTLNSPCSCTTPHTVEFKSCSEPGLQHAWMVFGGVSANQPQSVDQNVTYAVPGTYPIWLTVTDTNGCSHTVGFDEYVYVADVPGINIVGPDSVFAGSTAFFQAFNLDVYDWNVAPGSGAFASADSLSDYSVYFQQAGNYNVCLSTVVENPCGVCEVDTCKTIAVLDTPVGFHQAVFESMTITVHPNPTGDIAIVQFSQPLSRDAVMKLFDPTGRLAMTQSIRKTSGSAVLNVGQLPSGFYVVVLDAADGGAPVRLKLAVER